MTVLLAYCIVSQDIDVEDYLHLDPNTDFNKIFQKCHSTP